MTEDAPIQLKLISRLLHYPDEALRQLLPAIREVIAEIEDGSQQDRFERLLDYLEKTALIRLQADYTETFDLNPAHCLNLTYHRWGDGQERGPALIRLEEIYRQAGYERIDGELPDYLPLVLEFLAERPRTGNSEIIPQYGGAIATLAERLGQGAHPYGVLFERLVEIL